MEEENRDITIKDENGDTVAGVTVSYPPNSYASKEKDKETEKRKPVAHGMAVRRKKSFKERLMDLIFEPEGSDGYDYVYEDIIRPAALDMAWDVSHNILDVIQDTVSTFLFGSPKRGRRHGYYRTSFDDDYDEYWSRERRSRRRSGRRSDPEDEDRRSRSRKSTDAVAKVETRKEAVDLIKAEQDRVHMDGFATVLNFYEDADMPTQPSDDDYGWDLAHPFEASISRVRDGYIVEPVAPIWLDRS